MLTAPSEYSASTDLEEILRNSQEKTAKTSRKRESLQFFHIIMLVCLCNSPSRRRYPSGHLHIFGDKRPHYFSYAYSSRKASARTHPCLRSSSTGPHRSAPIPGLRPLFTVRPDSFRIPRWYSKKPPLSRICWRPPTDNGSQSPRYRSASAGPRYSS